MKFILLIASTLLMAACAQTREDARWGENTIRHETELSRDKIRAYFDSREIPRPQQKAVQSRYCYKTMSDIVCYQDPLAPDQDDRMYGYQEGAVQEPVAVGNSGVQTRELGGSGTWSQTGPFYMKESPWVGKPHAERWTVGGTTGPAAQQGVTAPGSGYAGPAPGRTNGRGVVMEEMKFDRNTLNPRSLVRPNKPRY